MSDTSLVFNALYRDRGVSTGLAKTSAAVRAAQVAATVGTVALGAAMAGTAAHAIALGQSAIVAAGAVALLPAALAGAVGTAIAAKIAFSGLGEAWKQTGAAAVSGGGSTVDIAHRVELAHREVRNATQALADAQRDAIAAQNALSRAREDEAERLEDLARSVARARLDERSATLGVAEARRRLQQARLGGDALEIRRAKLAYEESILTLDEVKDRVEDLAKEQAEANAKGVEGSDAVQSAAQQQEQAQRALVAATERLADAQRGVAEASKTAGGGIDKAAMALAALAPSAREVILTLRALAPAWTAAAKVGQQATWAGVAGDFRALSAIYLPMTTTWFGRMGAAFNDAMRSTFKLAQTATFARDVDTAMNGVASTTAILATAIRPVVNAFMQFVVVGSQILPGIALEVGSIARRFEAWAIAARESGRMQEWMTSGIATLKQFGEIAKNLVMSVVAIFRAGENTATLDGLVAASAAMRAWLESAEGQQKIADGLAFLRNIFTDLIQVVPAFTGNAGILTNTLSVFAVVMDFLAKNLDTFAAALPAIITAFVVWKSVQAAHNAIIVASIPLRVLEFVGTWRNTNALKAHTTALAVNTGAQRVANVSTAAGVVATNAADVATKRSLVSMVATRAALIAGAVATGVVTAAQWLWNAAMYANPIGLIILAVIAFIAVIILVIKYHKEIAAWIGQAWDFIWNKIKAFGLWLWNDLAPMVLNALTWPYRMAWEGIKWVWDKIQQGAAFARDFVIDKLLALVGFVTSLPGRMKTAAANLWDGLKDSFRAAINWLITKWNNFSLTLGGGNVMGMVIPSVTLSTPNIPLLDVGGRITATGLAVVHKGETVVPPAQAAPLSSSRPGGPVAKLIVGSDGSTAGRFLVEMLRAAVRDMGGDFDIVFET